MAIDLVAESYEPAAAYHAPKPVPYEFGAKTIVIAELMEHPSTRDVVSRLAPWAAGMYQSPSFAPHRLSFTLEDMATFIPGDYSKSISEVDKALRQLPKAEWPANAQ